MLQTVFQKNTLSLQLFLYTFCKICSSSSIFCFHFTKKKLEMMKNSQQSFSGLRLLDLHQLQAKKMRKSVFKTHTSLTVTCFVHKRREKVNEFLKREVWNINHKKRMNPWDFVRRKCEEEYVFMYIGYHFSPFHHTFWNLKDAAWIHIMYDWFKWFILFNCLGLIDIYVRDEIKPAPDCPLKCLSFLFSYHFVL